MIDAVNKAFLFISKGGWLMIPIILCSVISFAIIIERFFFFLRLSACRKEAVLKDVFDNVGSDKYNQAIEVCENNPHYITNILKSGLYKHDRSGEIIREVMEKTSLYQIPLLEKNLTFLSTLAHISPLLGLLGTVVGLVKSFYNIEQKAGSAGVINPSDIAGGIWEALLTTVAGLTVAIVCYIAYNYFVHKVNMCILEAEKTATELHEMIMEKHHPN
ncbi:MAG: MotA/TolQ/ExbB proton channel family protein [Candidatus Omnitrophota bacterium]